MAIQQVYDRQEKLAEGVRESVMLPVILYERRAKRNEESGFT